MTRRAAVVVVLAVLAAWPLAARRAPAPGGEAVVALPADLVEPTLAAHTALPLVERVVERDPRSLVARPPLASVPGWRSAVIDDVTRAPGDTSFTLTSRLAPILIATALVQCFDVEQPNHRWPAHVVRAAGITVQVETTKSGVVVTASRAVGPFLELLAGCLVPSRPLAPYADERRTLVAQPRTALEGPPSLAQIEVRPDSEIGDVVVGAGLAGVATVVAPYPDLLLLVPSTTMRERDPLGLAAPSGSLRGFFAELRPDLLAATYWAGRGGPLFGILPPGLAPARPLPDQRELGARPLPLALVELDPRAERVPVHFDAGDPLVSGIVERLAVLFRSRGLGISPAPLGTADGYSVVRWRPPSDDAALALLAFAGQHPALLGEESAGLLADPRLMSRELDERVAGAIALERAWLEDRAVIPLLFVELHFAIHPALRGVRVRPDGVPLLDDAYWSDAR